MFDPGAPDFENAKSRASVFRKGKKKAEPEKPTSFDLLEHVDARFIGVDLEFQKKEALFDRVAATFAPAIPGCVPADIAAAFWNRERTQNTSVGEGVAMPHATLPEARKVALGIFTLDEPMEYQAIDGSRVDVFFVTIGPPSDRNTHLQLLGALSKLVLTTDLLDRLRAATDAAQVRTAVEDAHRMLE